jgi:alkanesulfonate monooxygenase SsuD/methylene tetrahydromethanopterin reductase-like flavin-dependent oxidoreductase (luciferase family)
MLQPGKRANQRLALGGGESIYGRILSGTVSGALGRGRALEQSARRIPGWAFSYRRRPTRPRRTRWAPRSLVGLSRSVAISLRASSPLVGTPAEIVDKLGTWSDIGVQRVYAQMLSDLAVFGAKVMRQLS